MIKPFNTENLYKTTYEVYESEDIKSEVLHVINFNNF